MSIKLASFLHRLQRKEMAQEEAEMAARAAADEDFDREEGEIDSAPSEHVPHQLEHTWMFWFDNPATRSRQAEWGSSINKVQDFESVEDFWSLYNNIHHPSKLTTGADLYCFKDKIEPKWEDPVCEHGGKWTITCARGKSDNYWLYTLLALIGEQFDSGDEICGAVVNVRGKQERVSIWTKNAANEAAQLSIGKQWKEILDYNEPIGFIVHEEAKRLDRGAKNKYTI